MSKTTPTGFVLYRGASQIDGSPIVVIATLETTNKKTGRMIQTWILRDDISPTDAVRTGADFSVCGDCPLRGIIEKLAEKNKLGHKTANRNRGCYVTVHQAPFQVWRAYKRDRYPEYDPKQHARYIRGRKLRMGSYGEPVAAPLSVWEPLLRLASKHTGYTHQWRDSRFSAFSRYLMASVESDTDAENAKNSGWRFFQTLPEGTDTTSLPKGKLVCPASPEGGERRQCETCLGCNGSGNTPNRPSFVIIAHGSKGTLSGYRNSTQ